MKQTAVEWQHIELSKFLYGKSEFTDANDILIKAKEMEREQMCDFVEYCQTEHSKYQETEASWIKELTIDDFFEKRYTKEK
jgi:hypothetical protein